MWLDFTLSSVERGRVAVAAMGGPSVFSGRRVLDVGCAYGGFLVAAAEAGAAQVVGIDINPELLDLARLQLADHHINAELARDDVTSDGVAERRGTFDIVLCNDVIEHVVDPARCAANLSRLLRRGGKVFLEIPNGTAVDFMIRDGHYGLFGLTLLGRDQAEKWWRLHYHDIYGVEHYASLAYYLRIFSRVGISLRLLSNVDDAESRLRELTDTFDRLEHELADLERPDAPELVAAIRKRGREEIERFRQLGSRMEDSTVPAERNILMEDLLTTYGLTFWTLEGVKV
jgi:SAM-dependent methyltransferase